MVGPQRVKETRQLSTEGRRSWSKLGHGLSHALISLQLTKFNLLAIVVLFILLQETKTVYGYGCRLVL